MTKLPTKCEVACSGVSLILSQVLLLVAGVMYVSIWSVYDVNDEADLVEFHNTISKNVKLYQASCVLLWICFPLTILSVYGIKRILLFVVEGTWGEMLVYLAEKAYVLYAFSWVIIPSLLLTVSSYDWQQSQVVQNEYYTQHAFQLFELEFSDSVFIMDATFLIPVLVVIRYILWKSLKNADLPFQKLHAFIMPQWCQSNAMICVREFCIIGTAVVIFICTAMVLCEFAESGLFAPESYLLYLGVVLFIIKIVLGARLIWLSCGDRLKAVEDIFKQQNAMLGFKQVEPLQMNTQNIRLADDGSTPLDEYPDTK